MNDSDIFEWSGQFIKSCPICKDDLSRCECGKEGAQKLAEYIDQKILERLLGCQCTERDTCYSCQEEQG
jgi:hypothetical protein